MDRHDEHLPDDLRETAGWMRESRTQPSRLRLDELKQRTLRQAERSTNRGAARGLSARWRIRIVTTLVVMGLMMTGATGVVLATGGISGTSLSQLISNLLNALNHPSKDPSSSMYCPPSHHGDDDDDDGHGGYGNKSVSQTSGTYHNDDDDDGGSKDCIPCPKTMTASTYNGTHPPSGNPDPCGPKPGCGPDKTDGTAGNSGTHTGQPPKEPNRADCPDPPGQNKPSASCSGASGITGTAATLNGSVNPGGAAWAWIEYGTSDSYGSTVGTKYVSGTSPQGISASLSGLHPGTTYYFRVVAHNDKGTVYGGKCSFKTKEDKPDAHCGHSNVSYNGAKLSGYVNPHGASTSYYFVYGKSASNLSSKTGSQSVASGNSDVSIGGSLSGLSRHTTYYYKVVATNSAGSYTGEGGSFTTG